MMSFEIKQEELETLQKWLVNKKVVHVSKKLLTLTVIIAAVFRKNFLFLLSMTSEMTHTIRISSKISSSSI